MVLFPDPRLIRIFPDLSRQEHSHLTAETKIFWVADIFPSLITTMKNKINKYYNVTNVIEVIGVENEIKKKKSSCIMC